MSAPIARRDRLKGVITNITIENEGITSITSKMEGRKVFVQFELEILLNKSMPSSYHLHATQQ